MAHDWNESGIAWRSFADAVPQAQKDKKPICLIIFTETCPHCKNYSAVFHDPKVVERAKQFVMVHVDQGAGDPITQKYQPDGAYIPRTLFLKSDGTLEPDLKAPREKYQYFYDEKDPTSILAGMDAALKKLK